MFGQSVSIDGQSGTFIEISGQGTVIFTADGLRYNGQWLVLTSLIHLDCCVDCATDGESTPDVGGEDGAMDDATSICEAGSPAEVLGGTTTTRRLIFQATIAVS